MHVARSPSRAVSGLSGASASVGCPRAVVGVAACRSCPAPSLCSASGAARFSRSFAAVVASSCAAGDSVHVACGDTVSVHDAAQCCSHSPTGRKGSEGGVSGPAEDLRPVSEVEAGVNFRPAGLGTEAGCRFTSQEATRHRNQAGQGRCGTHLPSTRRFLVSNSCHLDADWTSDKQWAGRRCVVPHERGFGC